MLKRALIVDDNQDVREYVAEMMKEFGYEAEVFSNAEDALRVAASTNFDIIVADCNLGEGKMNGITFAHQFVGQLRRSDRPLPYVVLMSAETISHLEIGYDIAAFLQKPFTFAEFKRVLPS